jgi:3-oxoadipate enol-lactonase
LATIDVPTLVLAGGADCVAPPEQMQALAAAIPGSRYQVFERAGHLLNIERRDEFNETLIGFLRSVSSTVTGNRQRET